MKADTEHKGGVNAGVSANTPLGPDHSKQAKLQAELQYRFHAPCAAKPGLGKSNLDHFAIAF
jgi:hypothetical protein